MYYKMDNSTGKKCLSVKSTEFSRERTVLQSSVTPPNGSKHLSWKGGEKRCLFAPPLNAWGSRPCSPSPSRHIHTCRKVGSGPGPTCKWVPPTSGARMFSQRHEEENAMQIVMESMKIMQRMLSTSLADSCQNIFPSRFLTHHFQATSLILKARTVPHRASCKRVRIFPSKVHK